MFRRWPLISRRRRSVKIIFFLGTTALFLCWTLLFATGIYRTSGYHSDGGLLALVPAGAISSSLPNFALRGDDEEVAPTDHLSRPVYIAEDPAAGKFAVSDWKRLSKRWDDRSSFADLVDAADRTVETLPSAEPQSRPERIVLILHNHPKMASTTLRRACWENLRSTCDVVSPKRDPIGYSNARDLASLFDKCRDTHHFCVMGWHFDPGNFPNNVTSSSSSSSRPSTVAFVHLFPFRNFRDWSASAMKQVFVGQGEAGCDEVARRLENNNCDNGGSSGWLELDFAKYSKGALSRMSGILVGGARKQRPLTAAATPSHHFLLYDYARVHETLAWLGRSYRVPTLPYSDMRHKQIRSDGSCSNETLSRFHECFDGRLAEL